ncbi:MAG: FISUMP domain-containing protein [Flavobacteriaceae bacterium]|jgi:uncharacterized protein (TIGR02145 family)|nr:FISUMP domain-containing protein [Candidatus Kapabacteria bacterium]
MKGALYNWFVVENIAGEGWHVPTNDDWRALLSFLDPSGTQASNTAGGALKGESFDDPNTGATNSSGFNGAAYGIRKENGKFSRRGLMAEYWTSDPYTDLMFPDRSAMMVYLSSTSERLFASWPENVSWYIKMKTAGILIRLVKDTTDLQDGETGLYVGNDGRHYPTICIGSQEWLAEDLRETMFCNGDSIPVIESDGAWVMSSGPAMCYYNNTIEGIKTIIRPVKVSVDNCNEGIYLRWWFNGWHYYLFKNNYDVKLKVTHSDVQVKNNFSVISKTETASGIKETYSTTVTAEVQSIQGFTGLLMAECVEMFAGKWIEITLEEEEHEIRDAGDNGYIVEFTFHRKAQGDEPVASSRGVQLYINDILCDMEPDEVLAITKQVNDIGEMQDRMSDFTYEFNVLKTRRMQELFEAVGRSASRFPYFLHNARILVDGMEVMSFGTAVINKVTDRYYAVSVYSGNLDFFRLLENLNISDVDLDSLNHSWTAQVQQNSQLNDWDFIYPLCDGSSDGSMLMDDGSRVEVWGGWVWPFIRVSTIFERIISEAGYLFTGKIFKDDTYRKLFLPIGSRDASYIDTALSMYYVHVANRRVMTANRNQLQWQVHATPTSINGDISWKTLSRFYARYSASVTFRIEIHNSLGVPTNVYLYLDNVESVEMTDDGFYTGGLSAFRRRYVGTIEVLASNVVSFWTTYNNGCTYFSVEVIDIDVAQIGYGSSVPVSRHLPDITQTDFIKLICNMFCLIPETDPKKGVIHFWNYIELYDNIPIARDWTDYLSEQDINTEFRIGSYAQRNYLRYKPSDDVKPETGTGVISIEDETLEKEKTVIDLPVSSTDEVKVFDVSVSRINFATAEGVGLYRLESKIDPRIVYLTDTPGYTLGFRTEISGGSSFDVNNPKRVTGLGVAFSSLSRYYDGLSLILDKATVKRCRFNLPAAELSNLKHYIPVYLRQFGAYYYVNRVENYVEGRLATVELIKL